MRRHGHPSDIRRYAWLIIAVASCLLTGVTAGAEWQATLQQAESLLAAKKYAEALSLYEKAIAQNSACVPAYRGLVCCYDALGNAHGSVIYMETLYLEKPEQAEICYGLGYALYVAKKYADAARYFEKAIALQAELAEAWNNCAAIYHYVNRDYAKARQYYEKAIAFSSQTGNQRVLEIARENLAHLPDQQELAIVRAQLTLEEFINQFIAKAEEQSGRALHLLVCAQKENGEQAMEWFLAEALQASAHGRNSEEQTAVQLAMILEQHYRSCFDSFALRGCLEAYTGLDAASKTKLFKGESLLKAGVQQEQQGAPAAARTCYVEALGYFEGLKDLKRIGRVLLCIGDLDRSQKSYAQARDAYSKALTCFIEMRDEEQKAGALTALGASCYQLGQTDDALDFLKRAAKIYRVLHDKDTEQKVLDHIKTIEASRAGRRGSEQQ
jgi:tetratricopeptide (TPR) repeat protein